MEDGSAVCRDDGEVPVSISPLRHQLRFGSQFDFVVANKNRNTIILSPSKHTRKGKANFYQRLEESVQFRGSLYLSHHF